MKQTLTNGEILKIIRNSKTKKEAYERLEKAGVTTFTPAVWFAFHRLAD